MPLNPNKHKPTAMRRQMTAAPLRFMTRQEPSMVWPIKDVAGFDFVKDLYSVLFKLRTAMCSFFYKGSMTKLVAADEAGSY